MSILFELDEERLAEQLFPIFEQAEKDVLSAEPLFIMQGERLEMLLRLVPQHQAHYSEKALEMKAVMKWLENYKAKLEAIHLKNYSRGQRALSASDQKIFLGGEQNIIETNQLIIEATMHYNKLDSITEAFKQMGWMLGHVTKIRVAALEDVIL